MTDWKRHSCPICRLNSAHSYFHTMRQNSSESIALSKTIQKFQLDKHEIEHLKNRNTNCVNSASTAQEQFTLILDILSEASSSLPVKHQPVVQTYLEAGGDIVETAHRLGNIDLSAVERAVWMFHRRIREPSVQRRIQTRLSSLGTKEEL